MSSPGGPVAPRGEQELGLEGRLSRLEALRDIEELVYRYAELCDQGYDPDGLAELFTDDATWSSSTPDGAIDFGTYHGREAIRENFRRISTEVGRPTLHAAIAPRITLAPHRLAATGHWYTIVLLNKAEPRPIGSPVTFLGGKYLHEYRSIGGRWLFHRIAASLEFNIALPLA